eukprot:3328232-Rhodomonas_salina.2
MAVLPYAMPGTDLATLVAYGCGTANGWSPSPVLRQRMLQRRAVAASMDNVRGVLGLIEEYNGTTSPVSAYSLSGTDIARIALLTCYHKSGTDIPRTNVLPEEACDVVVALHACGNATDMAIEWAVQVAFSLRAPYAMPGTDMA